MVNIEDLVKLNQSTGATKRKGYDDVPVEDDDDSGKKGKTVEAKSKMEMKETETKAEEKRTGGKKKEKSTGSTEEHEIIPTASSVPSSGSKEPLGTEAKTPSKKLERAKEMFGEKKRQKSTQCCTIL